MEPRQTRFRLRVSPGASRSAVVGRYGDAWKVSVAAQPERGRANDAVIALLSGSLRLPRPDIRVVAGHGGRDKIVEVSGLEAAEIERRLDAARAEGS